MKITRNLPDQIIAEDRPIFWGICIAAMNLVLVAAGYNALVTGEWFHLAMIGVGIGMTALFFVMVVVRTMLILDRISGTIELRRRSVFGFQREHYALHHLSKAIVQTSSSSDGDTHRLALEISGGMDRGTRPVTLTYTSGNAAHHAAQAINVWLGHKIAEAAT